MSKESFDIRDLAAGESGDEREPHPNPDSEEIRRKRIAESTPDTSLRAKRLLDRVDTWFRKLDNLIYRYIPETSHPLVNSGAIANATIIIATITGFILLIWYRPSVHQAYDSVVTMADYPYTAELMRSLHRYSSDACMLFIVIHALKTFFAGRFSGARWVAWVTGIAAVALIWFDGWTGYWLVWDERGAMVATATAKMVDVLPFFAEPLSKSFLTNESFSSALMLVVFFIHMLIPLGLLVALWLHVSRLNKANVFPDLRLWSIIIVSLVILSLAYPADTAERADLLTMPESQTVDYFYLLPLFLTERLQGGLLWIITLTGVILFTGIPWFLRRKQVPTPPEVLEDKCTGCTQCFQDCPYNAITMTPRMDGNLEKSAFVASIDSSKCVECGICVGSCDPVGIEYPLLSPWDTRHQINQWLEDEQTVIEDTHVAFVCGNSAGASLSIDPQTGKCDQLPGYLVRAVPCAGWVHPSLVENILKKGAAGVVVAGCRTDPNFRLGLEWADARMEGSRHPELRGKRVNREDVCFLTLDRHDTDDFIRQTQAFKNRSGKLNGATVTPPARKPLPWKKWVAGIAIIALISGLTAWLSSAWLSLPPKEEAELVISFEIMGSPVAFDERTEDAQYDHMRREGHQRVIERAGIDLIIEIDGETHHEETYEPSGLFRPGYTRAIVEQNLEPGAYEVTVYLKDQGDEDRHFQSTRELQLQSGKRTVIRFDEGSRFQWHLPE